MISFEDIRRSPFYSLWNPFVDRQHFFLLLPRIIGRLKKLGHIFHRSFWLSRCDCEWARTMCEVRKVIWSLFWVRHLLFRLFICKLGENPHTDQTVGFLKAQSLAKPLFFSLKIISIRLFQSRTSASKKVLSRRGLKQKWSKKRGAKGEMGINNNHYIITSLIIQVLRHNIYAII